MPTTPYAKLLVSKNGGAPASGPITAVVGDVIQFSAESTVGWNNTCRWEFSFPVGYALPAGWSSEADASGHTVYYYLGNTQPPPFTIGAAWGKYMPRLLVNGGGGDKTDVSTAITVLSPNGLRDLGHNEEGQFGGATEAWAKDQRSNLRVIETSIAGVAADLSVLAGGTSSNADALHDHAHLVANGLTTTGLASGDFGYVSGANTVAKTDSAALASSRCIGANEGVSGRMTVAGVITAAKFTTAGGAPANGAAVYLAAAADDGGTGAGKLTATPPAAGILAEVGICLDAANYAGVKTCSVLLQIKTPIAL